MKRNIFKVGAGLVLLMLGGCITSTSYEYEPQRGKGNSQANVAKRIAYTLRRTARRDGGAFDKNECSELLMGAWAPPQFEKGAVAQFRKTFADVAANFNEYEKEGDPRGYDIKMDIQIQNSYDKKAVSIPAFISIWTFCVVPAWGDDAYTLYVEAQNANGLCKTYQLSGKVTTVVWLPFVFASPFVNKPAECVTMITDANWRELRARMELDGFFDSSK